MKNLVETTKEYQNYWSAHTVCVFLHVQLEYAKYLLWKHHSDDKFLFTSANGDILLQAYV